MKVIYYILLIIITPILLYFRNYIYRAKYPYSGYSLTDKIELWLYRRKQKKEVDKLRNKLNKQIEDRQRLSRTTSKQK